METPYNIAPINIRTRISPASISKIVNSIVFQFHPQKIILFGSYAYGSPRPESDIDLFVIMDTPLKLSQQAIEIRQYLNPLFGLDLIVYTPEALSRRLLLGDSFLQEIITKGKVLYESTDS
jgi:uncharacterized protein